MKPGSDIAAFFDMDRTLIRVNSGTRWLRFLHERRELSLSLFLRSVVWTTQYKLAILDMDTVAARLIADMAGDPEAELRDKAEVFVARHLHAAVSPQAAAALLAHRQAGHTVALLTSATNYVAEPLARHVGIEHVLCTRLHVEEGRFVGTLDKPCYGAGKVPVAERFAAERGLDLEASYFYTDSYSDLPMLLRVGERRVINPDPRLRRHARRAGWSIEQW